MKIRYGHVSNSSTSSFVGLGVWGDDIARVKGAEVENITVENAEEIECELEVFYNWDSEEVAFYLSMESDMRANETKLEFIARVEKLVESVFELKAGSSVSFIEDSYYNG